MKANGIKAQKGKWRTEGEIVKGMSSRGIKEKVREWRGKRKNEVGGLVIKGQIAT